MVTTPSSPIALVGEFLGTFALVISIFVSGGNALVIGGTLALIVYAIGGISGANVNPAVSLAAWLQGSMTNFELAKYALVQLAGGASASYLYTLLK